MDSFEANKVFGAVLGTVFVLFGGSLLAENIFHSEVPEQPGYAIVAPEPTEGGAPAAEAVPIATLLQDALTARDWKQREAAMGAAALAVARLHRARGLPGDFEPALEPYFSRPYTVINADRIGHAIRAAADDALSRSDAKT